MSERLKYEKWVIFFAILGDVVLINLSAIAAFLIRFGAEVPIFNFAAYCNMASFMTIEMCLFYYIFELYNTRRKYRKAIIIFNIVKGTTMGFIVLIGLTFFYRQFSFPRLVLTIFYFSNVSLMIVWRIILNEANNYLDYRYFKSHAKTRVLLLGADDLGLRTARKLLKYAGNKINIVGFVDDRFGATIKVHNLHVIGKYKELKDIIVNKDIEEVIFGSADISPAKMMELIQECLSIDVNFKVVPELLDVIFGRRSLNYVYGIPLIDLTVEPVSGWQANFKRLIDIVCALSGLIILLTMIPVIAIIEMIIDPGPLFYTQERLGKDGKSFLLIKFRTMYQGAEDKTGPVWASNKDSRITLFGNFMRRTKLDELPQVANILKGEMSIVGPRPERSVFAKPFLETMPFYKNRLLVLPGLTGWAQINQGSDETVEDVKTKLQYDLHYIENMSVLFDVEIILKTMASIFKQAEVNKN